MDRGEYEEGFREEVGLERTQRKSQNLPAGVSVKAFWAGESGGTKAQSYSRSTVGFRE